MVSRFPAAFRPPAFASRVILSRQGVGPSLRSAYRTTIGPDPDGVSMFHTRETRPGWVPPTPRGRRCSPGLGAWVRNAKPTEESIDALHHEGPKS